jgi:hypothetical protein
LNVFHRKSIKVNSFKRVNSDFGTRTMKKVERLAYCLQYLVLEASVKALLKALLKVGQSIRTRLADRLNGMDMNGFQLVRDNG